MKHWKIRSHDTLFQRLQCAEKGFAYKTFLMEVHTYWKSNDTVA